MLLKLIEITLASITTERELFQNPLEEPYFYATYFKRWVKEGMAERQKVIEQQNELLNTNR